ncbi:5-bromo-4-chloroindolyl phosphate hydrolysis protein [Geofilum rubicundum JCM 15548]|uniref:5-bromo-4-chloroindolyl phosphate hydrolysis protein n=2 Tax=Geofilum TaxID=1236988 RepID=A0A0E9LR10_9BACT|nr:5-bromo-4-chloroindolyl phosphate hydrolysis protein [Geofilum rubicundum JCM 15548]
MISAIVATALFFTVNALLGSQRAGQDAGNSKPPSAKDTSLTLAKSKLSEIEQTAMTIQRLEVRQKVQQICALGYNILDEINLRQDAIKTSRQFLNYYIDATGTIVTKYAELQSKTEFIPSAQASLDKVEKTLNTVESAFKKQLEKLYDKDVMNLDIELTVLAKTIKSEG